MVYSNYNLSRLKDEVSNYQEVCDIFLGLADDDETKVKLESILYNGGYKDFCVCSKIGNKDNPGIEMKRRVAMAYLLIRNPETFNFFVENQINLFHGTNANALPSILKYGINSAYESNEHGINVSTGERSTQIGRLRGFVSFTDVLDIAEDYSTLKSDGSVNDLSFEVVIGTTVNDVMRAGRFVVPSEVPEVGVKKKLPLESIKVICVPSDRVQFVKRLVGNLGIKVLALDDIRDKFYWIDDCCNYVNIFPNEYNQLKGGIKNTKSNFCFKIDEIKDVMVKWLLSKFNKNRLDSVGSEELKYDRRSR